MIYCFLRKTKQDAKNSTIIRHNFLRLLSRGEVIPLFSMFASDYLLLSQ